MAGRRKDAAVADGFNREKKGGMGFRELKKRVEGIAEEVKKKEEAVGKTRKNSKKKDVDELGLDDDDYKMLADMRAVYKSLGGKAKLMKLIKSDDKNLLGMIKDLMKIEGSLMAAKLKGKGDGLGGQAVFVILKGLQTEADILDPKKGAIDLNQVSDAINPSAAAKVEYEEEMVRPENG